MTLKELSEKYNLTESSIKNNYGRIQKSMLKKYGLILTKTGRGDKTDYQVTDSEGNEGRALAMSQEKSHQVMIAQDSLKTIDFNFVVFLAICMTPMKSFYGSYEGFLEYAELAKTKENLDNLKEALTMLSAADYIEYIVDKTDDNYFNVFIFKKVREDMAISLDMTMRCQRLAKENKKQSWIPLLKTWIGMQYIYDKQPFTMAELCAVTGLSPYQIRESKKILEKDNLFSTSKAYLSYDRCIGSLVDINGVCPENKGVIKKARL